MKARWLVLACLVPWSAARAQDSSGLKLHLTLEEGVHVGHAAPQLVLPYATADSAGPASQPFDLAKELGHVVVLVFYGRDNPAAAANWRAFAAHERLSPGMVVAGIARDGVPEQVAFARRVSVPYKLLSDSLRMVTRRYGLTPATFAVVVVDRGGTVQYLDRQFAPAVGASYVHLDAAIAAARETS